jgi:hypothetical protein
MPSSRAKHLDDTGLRNSLATGDPRRSHSSAIEFLQVLH